MSDDYEQQISRQYAALQDAVEILSLKLEATEARAFKYEQALRDVEKICEKFDWDSLALIQIGEVIDAALDKPEGK